MQTLTFNTVDVFTSRPFSGNSLAIVQQADALTNSQMQSIAREFNLPETIFIQSPADTGNTAKVRIFTPVDEIPFAGHPTIGCAIFLAEQLQDNGKLGNTSAIKDNRANYTTEIKLEEVAGLVPVLVERKQGQLRARLSAPVIPCAATKTDQHSPITFDAVTAAKAIGVAVSTIGTGGATPMAHTGGPTFLFVPLNDIQVLSQTQVVEPISSELSHAYGAVGIYVYYLDETTREIDARMFAPSMGIPEDPATGSATALLASQLHLSGQLVDGGNPFTIRQGYDMGRPSDLMLNVDVANGEIQSVQVSGSSVNISSGQVRIPE